MTESTPVAWMHEITEPDGQTNTLLSLAPDNPWSHWMESHRDKCSYKVTPLYASQPMQRLDDLDLCRQWFDAVQDLNRDYLEAADFALAKRIYEFIGMRVPSSITNRLADDAQ